MKNFTMFYHEIFVFPMKGQNKFDFDLELVAQKQ